MKKYTYMDHKHKDKTYHGNGQFGKIVFVCNAANILEADALYRVATGDEPMRQPHVGVSWE